MKTFLGTGLLGSAFVRAMLQRGDNVRVWNRTTTKAKKLEEFGAEASEDISDAVADVDLIHVCLKDDTSVDEVLAKAEDSFKPGATVVDHTTTSVKGAIERTENWKEKGVTYLHAPVMMGPQKALEGTGFILVSGNQAIIHSVEPELSKMTGEVLNFGEVVGKAAGMKLIGNLFLLAFTTGISDALTLAKSLDFSNDELQRLFSISNPGSEVNGMLDQLISGDFKDASWELNMARKDAGLMMKEADQGGSTLTAIPAIATAMDQLIEDGHAKDDWTVIAAGKTLK